MNLLFHNSEFEHEVREQLKIFDRGITDADALLVSELYLLNFDFENKDIDTLIHFKNLKNLSLQIKNTDSSFWSNFSQLKYLCLISLDGPVDFSIFHDMKNLISLTVSGGDYSDIAFENLENLIPLEHLEHLELHEFGSADLSPLASMNSLKSLAVRYPCEVKNIATIGKMTQLERLVLDGLYVENLDFLDMLPDSVELEMCGIEIYGTPHVDVGKWKRFLKRDICEIEVKNQYWEYIDLSALNSN